MADSKEVKSFLWGALAGAAAGAVTALLLAPKSGRELRGDLSDTAQQALEKTSELGRQAGEVVQSLAKKTSDLAVDAKQSTVRLVSDIRSRVSSCKVDEENEVAATQETNND